MQKKSTLNSHRAGDMSISLYLDLTKIYDLHDPLGLLLPSMQERLDVQSIDNIRHCNSYIFFSHIYIYIYNVVESIVHAFFLVYFGSPYIYPI